ncbi:MAG: carboxypeptidase-like regulatory domain-containing protein, partial [Planctomycetota bacterium]
MSPLRGIIALAIVAVAVVTLFLLRDSGQIKETGANTSLALADEAKTDEKSQERSVPEAASEPSTSGATRTEALEESLARPGGGSAKGAPQKAFGVSGTVLDEHGRPVAGAPVTLTRASGPDVIFIGGGELPGGAAKTAENGRFHFAAVPADDRLRVRVVPGDMTAAEASLPENRTGDIDIGTLTVGAGATFVGHVVGTAGQPVPNAEVRAWTRKEGGSSSPGMIIFGDAAPQNARSTKTDKSGFFSIPGLEPGDIHALVQAEGFTSESVKGIMIAKGATSKDTTITVSLGSSIQGVVVDATGSPLADAEVSVMETVIDLSEGGMVGGLGKSLTARSDADGSFRLAGLKSSTYNVTASRKGFLTGRESNVEAGTDDLRLSLARSGVLFGTVRNRVSLEPIRDYEVRIQGRFGPLPGEFFGPGGEAEVLRGEAAAALAGVTAAPELFAISDLSSRSVSLVVQADGFAEYQYGPVQVDSGSKVECQVQMVPEITVSGLVIDSEGAPVEGAAVSLRKESASELSGPGGGVYQRRVRIGSDGGAPRVVDGDQSYSDVTDQEGRFKLRGITPGEYSLDATHSEWAPSESETIALAEGDQVEDVKVALRSGGAVSGVTYDADGNVLAEARVTVDRVAEGGSQNGFRAISMGIGGGFPGGGDKSTFSDQEGKYRLGGILPGRYMVELHNPNQS